MSFRDCSDQIRSCGIKHTGYAQLSTLLHLRGALLEGTASRPDALIGPGDEAAGA